MLSREETISRLIADRDSRASYIRSKLNQLVPSQIRALRIKADMSQKQLGEEADMKQSRISASESGMANFSLETLIRLAASLKVGLQVKFVSYSELLDWDKTFSQDTFAVQTIEKDTTFINLSAQSNNKALANYGAQMCLIYNRSYQLGVATVNTAKSGEEYGQARA